MSTHSKVYSSVSQVRQIIIVVNDALRISQLIFHSSDRLDWVVHILDQSLLELNRGVVPPDQFTEQIQLPSTQLDSNEVAYAIDLLRKANSGLAPFTQEKRISWVKDCVQFALQELEKGTQKGEFDPNRDGLKVTS